MRRTMTQNPLFDGDRQIDSDQSRMTDYGCPLVPPRLPNQVERYKLSSIPTWLAKTRYQRLREELEMRGRWWSVCERMIQRSDSNIQLERSVM